MKVLVLLFAACLGVSHAAVTTIAQTITGPDGAVRNGVVTIIVSDVCTSGGTLVSKASVRVPFVGGSFTVQLTPNDTCLGWGGHQTTYAVNWQVCAPAPGASLNKPCPGQSQAYADTWFVPTTSSTLPVYGTGGVKIDVGVSSLNVAGLDDADYVATILNHSLISLVKASPHVSWTFRTWASLEGTTWYQALLLGAKW